MSAGDSQYHCQTIAIYRKMSTVIKILKKLWLWLLVLVVSIYSTSPRRPTFGTAHYGLRELSFIVLEEPSYASPFYSTHCRAGLRLQIAITGENVRRTLFISLGINRKRALDCSNLHPIKETHPGGSKS